MTRDTIAARAPGIWRSLEPLPVAAASGRSLAAGSTALVRRRRSGDRAARLRLRPGRPRAGQDRARPRLRRDGCPCRPHLRRHQPPHPRDRRRGGLGVRQHQPPPVLCRRQHDDRVRDCRTARLASAGRHRRPDCLRLDVHEDRQRASRSSPRSAWSSRAMSASSAASRRAAPRSRRRSPRASTRSGRSAPWTLSSARSRSARRPTVVMRWVWRAGRAARSNRSRTRRPRRPSGTRPRTRGSSSRPPVP